MKIETAEKGSGVSLGWAVVVVAAMTAAPLVGRALGLTVPGLLLGAVLAALGLRLAVMADGVSSPAADRAPAPGRRPERLHPAHV
ncbi:MAG: hypothetical protein HZB56_07025 [Deltaproteobacteria bacterium]|nr:hypothetical protein [Deltaproteobacteria bacterium]